MNKTLEERDKKRKKKKLLFQRENCRDARPNSLDYKTKEEGDRDREGK